MSGNQQIVKLSENNPIICCDVPLEFRLKEGESWRAYVHEIADCSDCNTHYERKPGKNFAYKKVGEKYYCSIDSEEILAAEVAHPIWDGPFPMSGSGKCYYEEVPYCLKHETKPSFSGTPISVGPKF